jgi:hypothetical protein
MAGPEVRIKAPTTRMKTIKPIRAYLFAFIVHLLSAAELQPKILATEGAKITEMKKTN